MATRKRLPAKEKGSTVSSYGSKAKAAAKVMGREGPKKSKPRNATGEVYWRKAPTYKRQTNKPGSSTRAGMAGTRAKNAAKGKKK